MSMKEIREELKSSCDIRVVFSGKKNGVSVYRVFNKNHPINSTEYTKGDLVKNWIFQ